MIGTMTDNEGRWDMSLVHFSEVPDLLLVMPDGRLASIDQPLVDYLNAELDALKRLRTDLAEEQERHQRHERELVSERDEMARRAIHNEALVERVVDELLRGGLWWNHRIDPERDDDDLYALVADTHGTGGGPLLESYYKPLLDAVLAVLTAEGQE